MDRARLHRPVLRWVVLPLVHRHPSSQLARPTHRRSVHWAGSEALLVLRRDDSILQGGTGSGGARQRTGEKEQDVIHGIRTGLTTADCLHIIRWVNRKGWWLGELMMVGDWVDRWGAEEEGKETVRDCAPKRGVFTSLLSLGIES